MYKQIILIGLCIMVIGCDNHNDVTVQKLEDLEHDNMHIRIGDILYSLGCRGDNPNAYVSTHYDKDYCITQGKTPIAYKEWDYGTNTGLYDMEGILLDELTPKTKTQADSTESVS